MKAAQEIRFDRFRLDLPNDRLWEGEKALALTPKALAVLTYLACHPGRRITKQELLGAVWGERFVSDGVLKVAVREIRKTLGDEVRAPRFIETVHRRGYRFIAELNDPSRVSPASRLPIVEREAALEKLYAWFALALEGRRQSVFITGEPGIGKTTLCEAFLDAVAGEGGCWATSGHCLEQFGAGEPYLPMLEALGRLCRGPREQHLVDLLRRHAPTWLMQMPSLVRFEDRERLERETLGATPERMLREMAEAVEALTLETPLVLVLEDLQWSDNATVDLVSLLARRPEPARLLLIGTYRPADLELRHHPLRTVRRELETHRRCRELALGYLSEAAVTEYLRLRLPGHGFHPGLAGPLHHHTGGNPLFLVGILDYLSDEGKLVEQEGRWRLDSRPEELELGVPESVRQLVEQQVDRLSEDERRVLEAASVVGTELSAAAVADALGLDMIEVEEYCDALADRRQFLYSAGVRSLPDGRVSARYAFIHSLYQQVLYQRIPDARLRRLHLKIGEGGERAFGAGAAEVAAELAGRFELARDVRRAVYYLRQAAETAVHRYANREASDYLTRAIGLAEETDTPLRDDLLRQRGRLRRAMGDMSGAGADFEALAASARERGQVETEVQGLLYLLSALYWVRRERCAQIVDQAVRGSSRIEDPLLRAHARGYCAHWDLNLQGWSDAAARAIRQALVAVAEAEDPELLALHVVRDVYFRCWQSDYKGAGRSAEKGLELAPRDPFDDMVCKFFWIWALLHGGEWGRIGPLARHSIDTAEKNGHGLWALMYRIELAWLHVQAFDFEEALKLCAPALERARRDPQKSGQLLFKSLLVLGFAHLGSGRAEHAYSAFQEILRVIHEENVAMDCLLYMPLHYGLSRCRLARRDFAAARREANRVCELAAAPGERTYLALGRRIRIEIALEEEKFDEAEAELEKVLGELDDEHTPLAAWRVYATASRVHRLRGRESESAAFWDKRGLVLERLASAPGLDEALCRSLMKHACTDGDSS